MWSPSSDCGLIPSSEQFMPYESLPSSTANSLCPLWCHCARSSLEFLMYSDDVQGACRYMFNWLRAWEALIASFLTKGFPKSLGMSADLPRLNIRTFPLERRHPTLFFGRRQPRRHFFSAITVYFRFVSSAFYLWGVDHRWRDGLELLGKNLVVRVGGSSPGDS